jgi:molybdate transport system regulatory protein
MFERFPARLTSHQPASKINPMAGHLRQNIMNEAKNPKKTKPSRFGRKPATGYSVQANIWIEKDGELYLGGGRIMLLENIDRLGSISAAARHMGLGYRNAWLWIDAMNHLAPSPLVIKTKGGSGGGYAELTHEGRKAISDYKILRKRLETFLEQRTST